jgi:hypothetical protein
VLKREPKIQNPTDAIVRMIAQEQPLVSAVPGCQGSYDIMSFPFKTFRW